ncbi:DUF485 domain-containing protein [Ancylobacter defluvii]|uniref:DUF485 domain-containing protein n=1 Tax=Ancylobacter defluvii TaxID=1282440 RepID=A0A9W6JVW0_9HYPH|nr:DUF485 domain-containing protein [Ancylobacter defluvii]MBS7589934.1 DUF485 domain-containing protein [Ancylobacter defluvii]GLK83060.1 hypothetical protein GCM10017653_11290 [Ancylobacter defluvii]
MTIQSVPVRAPAMGTSPPSSALTPRMPEWRARTEGTTFRRLIQTKRQIIGWLLGLSLGFFFLTLLLAGYARPFMSAKAFGALNVGYVLVIAIYLVTWGAALLYTLAAHRIFDPLAAAARHAAMREGTR